MTQELPDNISVCSVCDKHTNDDTETKWDWYADPYCKDCYEKEIKNCPHEDHVTWGKWNTTEEHLGYYDMTCDDCGAKGKEWFKLIKLNEEWGQL